MRKSFRTLAGAELEVLRGVSFTVEAGEIVAIMGASGAGKSTLLHLIGGLESPNDGTIRFGEFDVTKASDANLARYRRKDVGFVFQFHHLLPDLTAAENVALPLAIERVDRRQSLRRSLQVLEKIGLTEGATQPVNHLSGGEQQRVAVARALIRHPSLILADEPTGNVDAALGDEIGQLLTSYCRERGAVVIVATHNVRLARACDRVLSLVEGVIGTLE